jgi:hypothetical protein
MIVAAITATSCDQTPSTSETSEPVATATNGGTTEPSTTSTSSSAATTNTTGVRQPVLSNQDVVGRWNLIDAEPPPGVDKPTDMHNQYFEFSVQPDDGALYLGRNWNCETGGGIVTGLGTDAWPGGGEAVGVESNDCTEAEFLEGIWTSGLGLDIRSFGLDEHTMTATGDDGWSFTFERQPNE